MGKRRSEWITKAMKRSRKTKDRGIVDFIMVVHHFLITCTK